MRVSSMPFPSVSSMSSTVPVRDASAKERLLFQPFTAQAFAQAHRRHVPVFLLIGEAEAAYSDPALSMHLRERTVPVQLLPGMRPDVELLCQRAGVMFSQEGALPLCALLLSDGRPFLAAPLPPPGFALDPSRLLAWLFHADRRFIHEESAIHAQAAQVMRSFHADPLRAPYTPQTAAHDLKRALFALEDRRCGGFGVVKAPFITALCFLHHAGLREDGKAQAVLSRALRAMLAGALYDPLDGGFFRATLTDDWRVFVPRKMTALTALLALLLLENGQKIEALRALQWIINSCTLPDGAFAPFVCAPKESYAFTPEQVCAALGDEDGLRVCRMLSLLHRHAGPTPQVTPSRFSPVGSHNSERRLSMDADPLTPRYPAALTPEDAAFLARVRPELLRARTARSPRQPAGYMLTMDCALTAAVLAAVGRRLGEARYTQAAQRAVSRLTALPPVQPFGLPPAFTSVSALHTQADCGACAALSLSMLTLAMGEGMEAYAAGGLRLLNASLRAFVRKDGLVMSTPEDRAACFPRMPAIYDSELPSSAALLVHALRLAHAFNPHAHYEEAIGGIWQAAAPGARMQPLATASLIDAMTCA